MTATQRRIDLDIEGMTCASCVSRVERKLNKLDGVEASVNLPLNQASVQVAGDATTRDLIAAVESAGYTASLHSTEEETAGAGAGSAAPDRMNEYPTASALKPRLIGAAILTVPLFLISMFATFQFPHWGWVALVLSAPVTFWAGWPFHIAALRAAKHKSSTMDTLVSIGVTTAWLYSTVELLLHPGMTAEPGHHHSLYYETAAVVTTFLLLGRYLEDRAKTRAGDALRSLLNLGAREATVIRNGQEVTIPAAQLVPGDEFVVRPGEKIATDGFIIEGHSALDTSLITGESVPEEVAEGDTVTGATINTSGRLLVRATRTGKDTTLAQMAQLVSDAQTGKAPIARLTDRISAVFVPVVLVIAVLTLALWLIISGDTASSFRAAVTVLVIACPCALGLATPVGLLAGTGRASQLGILIRGPEVLEDTRGVNTIVLDKTGTVTEGKMAVDAVSNLSDSFTDDDVLAIAGAVESGSEHPIARAIVDAARGAHTEGQLPAVNGFTSTAGGGVTATVDHHREKYPVAAGRSTFITEHLDAGELSAEEIQALADAEAAGATAVWLAINGKIAGIISLKDTIKASSREAIGELLEMGLTPILLTGDNESVARQVAQEVGIAADQVFAGVRPEDKVTKVKELQASGRVVAMVGDGLNDAPALAQADLGIAMGSGTDVAQEAAEITVMGSDLNQVVDAIKLSRKTLGVIKSNLFWAFAYNTLGIPVAAFGLLSPMIAGAAMAASSILVVANSLRLTRFKR